MLKEPTVLVKLDYQVRLNVQPASQVTKVVNASVPLL